MSVCSENPRGKDPHLLLELVHGYINAFSATTSTYSQRGTRGAADRPELTSHAGVAFNKRAVKCSSSSSSSMVLTYNICGSRSAWLHQ